MRLWAEERKTGTIELLMTLPISPWEAILGKFLAAWAFIGLALVLTFPMWITVNILGRPDNGVILASYLGSFLTAGAFLAIGSCISALTKNQVIAFIVAAAICFLLVMSGARDGAQRVPRLGAAVPDRGDLLAELPHPLRGLHQGHLLAARPRLLRVGDRLRPVREQDHPRPAQSRLRGSHTMHPTLDKLVTAAKVHLDSAAKSAAQLDPHKLAWGGLVLAAITFLAVNLFASTAFRGVKMDLTRDGLYTISDGTRKALKAIDEPIDVRVYFSKRLGDAAPTYAKNFDRVRSLLERYRDISGGKLQVSFLDPEPFSDAEDRAVAAGLKGIRLNQEGDQGYFGLVGTNATDNEASIGFFAADRERFLEYDVTKLVYTLANPKKRVIGMISSIPLDGAMPAMMRMGAQPTPPQMVMEQIREFFEVKTLEKDLKEIPADIDVLMLVQPEGLTPDADLRHRPVCARPAARCWCSSIRWPRRRSAATRWACRHAARYRSRWRSC